MIDNWKNLKSVEEKHGIVKVLEFLTLYRQLGFNNV